MLNRPQFQTKKAAREAGLRTYNEWIRRRYRGDHRHPVVPRRDAVPVDVKDEEFFAFSDCEALVSRSEAGRRDLAVPKDVEAVTDVRTMRDFGYVCYELFRVSDCVERRQQRVVPPVQIDLLQALFTANKAAKRLRDAAECHYNGGRYGLATNAKHRKDALYALKDRGIVAAYQSSRIALVCVHGRLAVYRGEGYCFHSLLVPAGFDISSVEAADEGAEHVWVDASPKGKGEARLKDAEYTLRSLPICEDGFVRLTALEDFTY